MRPSVEDFWQMFVASFDDPVIPEKDIPALRFAFFAGAYAMLRGYDLFLKRGGKLQDGMAGVLAEMTAECRAVVDPEPKGNPDGN